MGHYIVYSLFYIVATSWQSWPPSSSWPPLLGHDRTTKSCDATISYMLALCCLAGCCLYGIHIPTHPFSGMYAGWMQVAVKKNGVLQLKRQLRTVGAARGLVACSRACRFCSRQLIGSWRGSWGDSWRGSWWDSRLRQLRRQPHVV